MKCVQKSEMHVTNHLPIEMWLKKWNTFFWVLLTSLLWEKEFKSMVAGWHKFRTGIFLVILSGWQSDSSNVNPWNGIGVPIFLRDAMNRIDSKCVTNRLDSKCDQKSEMHVKNWLESKCDQKSETHFSGCLPPLYFERKNSKQWRLGCPNWKNVSTCLT